MAWHEDKMAQIARGNRPSAAVSRTEGCTRGSKGACVCVCVCVFFLLTHLFMSERFVPANITWCDGSMEESTWLIYLPSCEKKCAGLTSTAIMEKKLKRSWLCHTSCDGSSGHQVHNGRRWICIHLWHELLLVLDQMDTVCTNQPSHSNMSTEGSVQLPTWSRW